MPRAWTRRGVTQQGPQFARTGGLSFSRAATRVMTEPVDPSGGGAYREMAVLATIRWTVAVLSGGIPRGGGPVSTHNASAGFFDRPSDVVMLPRSWTLVASEAT